MTREISFIMALVLIGAVTSAVVHPKAPAWFRVEEVSRWDVKVDEIPELFPDPAEILWIDARPEKLFAKGHMEGAILLNEDRWGELVFEHQDRLQEAVGKPVIVYCDGTGCKKSKSIAERLRQTVGLDPVYILKGDWRKLERTRKGSSERERAE